MDRTLKPFHSFLTGYRPWIPISNIPNRLQLPKTSPIFFVLPLQQSFFLIFLKVIFEKKCPTAFTSQNACLYTKKVFLTTKFSQVI